MNVLEQVKQTIYERDMASPQTPVLLMVSGGSDSTALAYLATHLHEQQLVGPLALVHVNHMLRGADATADAVFVQNLAHTLNIPCFSAQVNVPQLVQQEKGNTEAIARRERYACARDALKSLCEHEHVSPEQGRIFVAHTQDDRVETFYMRSIVGTGPGGFRSMVYTQGCVCRPLLDVSRAHLRDYVVSEQRNGCAVYTDEQGNLWREDATNECVDYFRNYVRQEIVPRAAAKNANIKETLCRTMNLIADEDEYLSQCAHALYHKYVVWLDHANNTESLVSCSPEACVLQPALGTEPAVLVRRGVVQVLKRMLGQETRIDALSVQKVCKAYNSGKPVGGYVVNIQGNLAVSANARGVRIEPMYMFRARRKRV